MHDTLLKLVTKKETESVLVDLKTGSRKSLFLTVEQGAFKIFRIQFRAKLRENLHNAEATFDKNNLLCDAKIY